MHKRTIVKEEKNGYLRYHASTEENSAGFLANCQSAPGHCTGFKCSKQATLALKPLELDCLDVTAVVTVLIAQFKDNFDAALHIFN